MLLAAVCFEGIARRYTSAIPGWAWYFLKDALLIAGIRVVGLGQREWETLRGLYRPFALILMLSWIWALLQLANPLQVSSVLALVGLRAYTVWWLAPLLVARALKPAGNRRAFVAALAVFSLFIAAVAAIQFESPGDAAVNQYAWGSDQMGVAGVAETGRVRVISTFSYLTGFTDFAVLALPLLLAFGLSERRGRLRLLSLLAAAALAISIPMAGSRGPIVLSAVGTVLVFWTSGAFKQRRGLVFGALLAGSVLLALNLAPEAARGVESRFRYEDTVGRIAEVRLWLPPFAMAEYNYPVLGIGTGMQQNAKEAIGVRSEWNEEGEPGRLLIELGPVGYLLVWLARMGLVMALVRAYLLLRINGAGAMAGIALLLAALSFTGSLVFDHVWQALYFIACGVVLQAVTAVKAANQVRSLATSGGRP